MFPLLSSVYLVTAMFLLFPFLTLSSASLLSPAYLTVDEAPDPGPALDTAYVPGNPGAAWTEGEIESTRLRILQAIHPDWDVKKEMYGRGKKRGSRYGATENKIMRLVFHDCVR